MQLAQTGEKMSAWLMVSVIALLPFSNAYLLPELLMLLLGLHLIISQWRAIWAVFAIRLFVALFLCYWVPTAVSTIDAFNPAHSIAKSAALLGILPAGIFAVYHLRNRQRLHTLGMLVAVIVAFWCFDAIVQFLFGRNLLGMPLSAERLNGVFGETNIKLGQTLAVLSPILIEYCRRNHSRTITLLSYLLVLIVVVLSGTRAAWVSFVVVSFLYLVLYAKTHPSRWIMSVSGILLVSALIGFGGYHSSQQFAERIDRTLAAFNGDQQSVDFALSNRLPIWKTALNMTAEHPINGVGIRGFRFAYPSFAGRDDPWVGAGSTGGASHPHHIILEVLAETGIIGLIGLLLALTIIYQSQRKAAARDKGKLVATLFAITAMTFPINTHLAFYSSYWSLIFWWLLIVYCARIGDCELNDGKVIGIPESLLRRARPERL